jgi:hypothetical protein
MKDIELRLSPLYAFLEAILETDFPCPGVWFVDECMRRVRR